MRVRLGLHYRLVIPFVLVALAGTAAAAFAALWIASRTLEERVSGQLRQTAAVVARRDFAVNRAILRNVHEITGAHVLTFTTDGRVLAGTLDDPARADLVARVVAAGLARPTTADGPAEVTRMDCGAPCAVAYAPVSGRPGTLIAVVAESSELIEGTRAVTRTILVAAVLSVIAMMLASQLVARRVTAPLAALSTFARGLSAEGPHARAVVTDDEVGRLAAAFNDMLDRVEQSQAAVVRSEKLALAGLLAARVAHDIRNPLSSIKLQAQLLQAGDVTADQGEVLGAILHDIVQVESVIDDLLELARPGALRRQPAQVNDVIEEALAQMRAQLTYRKIAVLVDTDDALPRLSLDVARLKQALLNVLVNAGEALTTGGTIRVRSHRAGDAVVIDVQDDGPGLDPALLERAFDPFVSTKRDGVGLGLVNARAVVESHGGRIVLERCEPHGTRARITLPLDTAAADGAAAHA